jgi:oligopeptidase A
MRMMIIGALTGELSQAARIAMGRGARIEQADTRDAGLATLRRDPRVDLVLCDLSQDVPALIRALVSERIAVPVVACSIDPDPELATAAIRAGAREFLPLPPDAELIAAILDAVAGDDKSVVVRDRVMQATLKRAEQVAAADASVLITGESGTGKEVLARHIHARSRRAKGAFVRECRELEEFKAQQTGGVVARLAPWEILIWSEKLRQSRYNFDEEILRPYFPMDRVIAGLFELAGRVFGLRVIERSADDVETWHAEVKFYDVRDARGRHVGSFYADWYPRESKRGGAWMNYLLTGGPRADGSRAPHLGLMCGNMTPPSEGQPALLKHREVETIFHEFGHLLHHLLGEVEIKSLNGVNVAWDFVELPSQIMENWTWERESLDLFARHHETGAAIPEEIFLKLTAAKNFRSACVTMRQVALAKMDLLMHMRTAEFAGEVDVEVKARAAVANCLVPTEPPAPTVVKKFTHIFSDPVGYAAGYYSYKWAEVLDADAFTRFKREGIFNTAVGAEFIETILSQGNATDPAELFRRFMGRDPDLQALLVRCGLAA